MSEQSAQHRDQWIMNARTRLMMLRWSGYSPQLPCTCVRNYKPGCPAHDPEHCPGFAVIVVEANRRWQENALRTLVEARYLVPVDVTRGADDGIVITLLERPTPPGEAWCGAHPVELRRGVGKLYGSKPCATGRVVLREETEGTPT